MNRITLDHISGCCVLFCIALQEICSRFRGPVLSTLDYGYNVSEMMMPDWRPSLLPTRVATTLYELQILIGSY